jgi:hypothetical protein
VVLGQCQYVIEVADLRLGVITGAHAAALDRLLPTACAPISNSPVRRSPNCVDLNANSAIGYSSMFRSAIEDCR